jgi:hypothetical protein
LGKEFPNPVRSAPVFVYLPPGQSASLPLETPPPTSTNRGTNMCPVVLQMALPQERSMRVEDLPWSEGYAYGTIQAETEKLMIQIYNFSNKTVKGKLDVTSAPPGWQITYQSQPFAIGPRQRASVPATIKVPPNTPTNGWITLAADCGKQGQPVLAARFVVKP